MSAPTPGPKRPGLSQRQKKLLEFLKSHEKSQEQFTADDIAEATGLKLDSVRAYISEGHWNRVLVREGKRFRTGHGVSALSEREFQARISQSKHVQSFAYGVTNALAASLLGRSRDNMVLALELYNRPSLANRLDGFVMLYCAAWEQMLKAELIERDGEDSIFIPQKEGQQRRSIGLTEAIARILSSGTPVRANLEDIQEIRDRAVHLLIPQLQPVVARLFQSGVYNFASHFKALSGEAFVPHSAVGLLTLVADGDMSAPVNLDAAYGVTTRNEVNALFERLSKSIQNANSWEYAVPLEYRLMFSDKEGLADVVLTKAGHDALDARKLIVVEKTKDRRHTHPHLPRKAVALVAEGLRAELTEAQLSKHLVSTVKGGARFSDHDFQAIAWKEKWRNSNNEFHHHEQDIARRWYSQKAVDRAVELICKDPNYLKRARESYAARTKRQGTSVVPLNATASKHEQQKTARGTRTG